MDEMYIFRNVSRRGCYKESNVSKYEVVGIETKRKMEIREGESQGEARSQEARKREREKSYFFFLNVKLPKRRRFGSLYGYNSVTREKGIKKFIFLLIYFFFFLKQ